MFPSNSPRDLVNPYAGYTPPAPHRSARATGRAVAAGAIGLGALAAVSGTAAADESPFGDDQVNAASLGPEWLEANPNTRITPDGALIRTGVWVGNPDELTHGDSQAQTPRDRAIAWLQARADAGELGPRGERLLAYLQVEPPAPVN